LDAALIGIHLVGALHQGGVEDAFDPVGNRPLPVQRDHPVIEIGVEEATQTPLETTRDEIVVDLGIEPGCRLGLKDQDVVFEATPPQMTGKVDDLRARRLGNL